MRTIPIRDLCERCGKPQYRCICAKAATRHPARAEERN